MNNQNDTSPTTRNSDTPTSRGRLFLVGIVVFALIVAAVAVFWTKRSLPVPGEFRAAAILNLSGPASRFDAVKQQALKVAENRVRLLFPDTKLSVRVFDAGGGPDATASSVRQAMDWRASAYMTGTSPTALAVANSIRQQVPQPLHFGNAANPAFGPPLPNEYRFWPDWNQEASIIQTLMAEEKFTEILVIYSADPYSEALLKALKTKLEPTGQKIALEQQFDPAGTPDFRPILVRAKEQKVSALVIFGLPPGINALANQLAEVQWQSAVIGGVNLTLSVQTFQQLKLACPLWALETDAMAETLPPDSEAATFREAYRKEFGQPPPFHSLYLADALYLLGAAQSSAQKNGSSISEEILKGLTFQCSSGTLSLDESGVLTIPMHPKRIQ